MILIDTNILSALIQRRPDPIIISWLNQQASASVWTSSITLFEAHYGLEIMAEGARRRHLQAQFKALIKDDLGNRVLSFDQHAAAQAASLAADRKTVGKPIDMRDTFIAGIAISQSATLVTGNSRHFEDLPVPVFNPWDS